MIYSTKSTFSDSESEVVGEHLETIMNSDKELLWDEHTRDVPNLETLHKLNSDETCSKRSSQPSRSISDLYGL